MFFKRRKKKLKRSLTVWARSSKAFTYYGVWAVIWIALYKRFFTARDFFRGLDVLCYVLDYIEEAPRAALCVLLGAMVVYGLSQFCGVLLNMYRIKKQDKFIEQIGSSCGIDGVQGIGKTRLIVYMGLVLQFDKWRDLLYNYYIQCPIEEKLLNDYNNNVKKEEYIRFKSQKESVEAYKSTPEHIPLIYSNIKVYFNGKVPRDLGREHFTQDKRLYENNIKLASELDNILPNTLRKVKDEANDELKANLIDEFVGLDRQYTGGTLIADTHRNGALYLPVRDCQQMKIHLIAKKIMYTPKLFKFCFEKLKDHVVNKTEEKTSLFLRKLCKWFEKQTKSIGFTKIDYVLERGAEGLKSMMNKEQSFLMLPNQVPYTYDDRILQKDYLALGYRDRPKIEKKESKKKKRKKEEPGSAGDI